MHHIWNKEQRTNKHQKKYGKWPLMRGRFGSLKQTIRKPKADYCEMKLEQNAGDTKKTQQNLNNVLHETNNKSPDKVQSVTSILLPMNLTNIFQAGVKTYHD